MSASRWVWLGREAGEKPLKGWGSRRFVSPRVKNRVAARRQERKQEVNPGAQPAYLTRPANADAYIGTCYNHGIPVLDATKCYEYSIR
jgi:hypothetical protein